MKLIVVIPAYNEASIIGDVITGVKKFCDEIIVVDDGSRDLTSQIAAENGATVLRHMINRGQGAALKTGTELALLRGAEIIVHFDADGQEEPKEISELVQPICDGLAEVVIGSRFLGRGSNMPLSRKLILKGGILFTWFFSGIKLSDAHTGFRVLSRKAAKKIQITQDGMAHASEIIDEIGYHKLKYLEMPITVSYTPYSMAKGQKSLAAFKIAKDFLWSKLVRK